MLADDVKKAITQEMNVWRAGFGRLPIAYIDAHLVCASADKERFADSHGYRIITTEVVKDGWGDGMQGLRLICEDRAGKLRDFRWTDANGGSWFEHGGAGSKLIEVAPNRPGYL